MSATTRTQRTYDHRLRDLIRSTGDIHQATGRGIPRSTARGWLTSSRAEVLTVDGVDRDIVKLQKDLLAHRRRLEWLIALLRLVILLWKFSEFSLTNLRIPDRARKLRLLRAMDRSHSALPLRSVLRVLRLSHSRFHAWKHEEECGLDDLPSCPSSSPQLTAAKCKTIEEMVTSDASRHVPTGTLARLAQRLDKVFASSTTWYRLVRQFQWRRPRWFPWEALARFGEIARRRNIFPLLSRS